jgi:hypothetical protein
VVLDGNAGPHFNELGRLIFSPDGSRLAYSTKDRNDKAWNMMIDGKPGPAYDLIGFDPAFSPDNRHIAYAAKKQGKWCVVLDGKELADYELVYSTKPGFRQEDYTGSPSPFHFDATGTLNYIGIKDGQIYRVQVKP